MAPCWRKQKYPQRERERERAVEKNPSSRVPSFKFHDLHFICEAATPPDCPKKKKTELGKLLSLRHVWTCFICALPPSLTPPSCINHKYTHISFEIICGILAIIHSPRLLLLSLHPCALYFLLLSSPLLPSLSLVFFRKLSFSFFAA